MSLIELKIDRIQYGETQTGAYVLFLKDPISKKKLPIVIGGLEAQAITIGLEKDLKPQRPLTHDLMKSIMMSYKIRLNRVIINKFDQGIFYAMLITEKNGIEKAIDSRTSDAVAIAVRFDVPIFCESSILEEAGIFLPDQIVKEEELDDLDIELDNLIKEIDQITQDVENQTKKSNPESSQSDLSELETLAMELFGKKLPIYTKKEIQDFLSEAIEDEQYERAAKLKRYLELL